MIGGIINSPTESYVRLYFSQETNIWPFDFVSHIYWRIKDCSWFKWWYNMTVVCMINTHDDLYIVLQWKYTLQWYQHSIWNKHEKAHNIILKLKYLKNHTILQRSIVRQSAPMSTDHTLRRWWSAFSTDHQIKFKTYINLNE